MAQTTPDASFGPVFTVPALPITRALPIILLRSVVSVAVLVIVGLGCCCLAVVAGAVYELRTLRDVES